LVQPKAASREKTEEQKEERVSAAECVSYLDAEKFIGKEQCITGKVDNVYASFGGTVFLNFALIIKLALSAP